MAQRSSRKTTATVTRQDYLLAVLVVIIVASAGIIGYGLGRFDTHTRIPEMAAIEAVSELQGIVHQAIDHRDWKTACLAQQKSVDIMLQENFGDEFIDRAEKLEKMICDRWTTL